MAAWLYRSAWGGNFTPLIMEKFDILFDLTDIILIFDRANVYILYHITFFFRFSLNNINKQLKRDNIAVLYCWWWPVRPF